MKIFIRIILACLFLQLVHTSAKTQHLPDTEFKPSVAKPAYLKSGPRVLFDEAHFNYHPIDGRYKPFADLLSNDGYRVVRSREPFTKKTLETFKVLVIVDALAEDIDEDTAAHAAFTEDEVGIVREWVKGGGALLFVADPGPFAHSMGPLAAQFGIEMGGQRVRDAAHAEGDGRSDLIVYSRDNRLMPAHPITQGRGGDETLNRVIAFSGQALKGPETSFAFLKLSGSAQERTEDGSPNEAKKLSPGSAQGLAFKFGSGRVVAVAGAEMLTALLGEPPAKEPIGINYPGTDNKQLVLNIMHWLSGLLAER